METDLRKTQIVEFYGIPGSGKSSVSHLTAEELRKLGYSVDEPTYTADHGYSGAGRKLHKAFLAAKYAVRHPGCFSSIRSLAVENGYSGSELISQLINILYKIGFYDILKGDYIVFDEGMIQSSLSLAQNGTADGSENYGKLLKAAGIDADITRIFIDVEPETAVQRMAERGTADSRADRENDMEKKMRIVGKWRADCTDFAAHYASITVNGNAGIEDEVSCILNYLKIEKA